MFFWCNTGKEEEEDDEEEEKDGSKEEGGREGSGDGRRAEEEGGGGKTKRKNRRRRKGKGYLNHKNHALTTSDTEVLRPRVRLEDPLPPRCESKMHVLCAFEAKMMVSLHC